jgi:hypothetical protein
VALAPEDQRSRRGGKRAGLRAPRLVSVHGEPHLRASAGRTVKANLVYQPAVQKKRMAQFEKWVKRARADWRAGYAVMIIPYGEWLDLAGQPPSYTPKTDRRKKGR